MAERTDSRQLGKTYDMPSGDTKFLIDVLNPEGNAKGDKSNNVAKRMRVSATNEPDFLRWSFLYPSPPFHCYILLMIFFPRYLFSFPKRRPSELPRRYPVLRGRPRNPQPGPADPLP